jgi:hypothetical protein
LPPPTLPDDGDLGLLPNAEYDLGLLEEDEDAGIPVPATEPVPAPAPAVPPVPP